MKITPIKTDIVWPFTQDITDILANALTSIPENSILAITSKVISLCEGNVIATEAADKDELIQQEADLFLPKGNNQYNVYLTIKNNILIPNAGIDESNASGYYVLWPKDPQASAERCWRFIKESYQVRNFGIIITDSTVTPLRWGVTGTCLSHCGFSSINNHVGRRDLFGRIMSMTKVNVVDAFASAAVLCMGETDEQTPIALIEDVSFTHFQDDPPTGQQLDEARIDPGDDLFGQLLICVPWRSHKK